MQAPSAAVSASERVTGWRRASAVGRSVLVGRSAFVWAHATLIEGGPKQRDLRAAATLSAFAASRIDAAHRAVVGHLPGAGRNSRPR
jgi:hypothetical protein